MDPKNNMFEQEENKNKQFLEVLLRDYLPYWPVLLTFAVIGFFLGKVYIRYQVPQYRVDAGVLLKDASEESTDDLLRKAVTGKSSTSTEDEIEVLQGAAVMRRAVKKAESQLRLISVGRFRSGEVYREDPAVKISLLNPDSAKSASDNFDYDHSKKLVTVGKKKFPVGQVFDWKGNRILVTVRSTAKNSEFTEFKNMKGKSLYLQVSSLEEATMAMQHSLKVEVDKKSSIINIGIVSLSVLKSKDHLNAVVESYQEETQAEKRKKARFTMDFIDDRLSYIGKDLDSIETKMVSVKRDNDVQRISVDAQRVLRKLESEIGRAHV
jgi:uncharacterized protein involved in exopolysaccharide biosynthesis